MNCATCNTSIYFYAGKWRHTDDFITHDVVPKEAI